MRKKKRKKIINKPQYDNPLSYLYFLKRYFLYLDIMYIIIQKKFFCQTFWFSSYIICIKGL